jgi:isovaleryl-CoA dehydrogenase
MQESPFDSLLNEDQVMIAQAVRDFCKEAVLPKHEALDHHGTWPEELWEQIGELGLFGSFLSEDQGGAGAGFLAHAVAIEGLATGAGLAGALLCGQGIVVDAVARSGHSKAADWIEGLATGSLIGAPAMVEELPGVLNLAATGTGDQMRLMGEKLLVPAPGRAGLYLVLAKNAEGRLLAVVEADAAGLTHTKGEANLGLSGYETGTLVLNNTPAFALGGNDLVGRGRRGCR